jgi:intein-encoded DNA endonuclease-like protein
MTAKDNRCALAIVIGFTALAAFIWIDPFRAQSPLQKELPKTFDHSAIEEVVYSVEDEVQEQYVSEYLRGYNAFLQQQGQKPLNVKVKRYTNFQQPPQHQTEEEKKNINETLESSYVRGYHDAADSLMCPRYKMPQWQENMEERKSK